MWKETWIPLVSLAVISMGANFESKCDWSRVPLALAAEKGGEADGKLNKIVAC